MQMALAAAICEAAGPVVPTGKKSSGSSSLHRAWFTQSIDRYPSRSNGPEYGRGREPRSCLLGRVRSAAAVEIPPHQGEPVRARGGLYCSPFDEHKAENRFGGPSEATSARKAAE